MRARERNLHNRLPLKWLARSIGVLAGVAVGVYGFGLYAIRCFDTCPTDPAENRLIILLVICLISFGIVIVSASLTAATAATRVGLGIDLTLGVVIVVCGTISILQGPMMQRPDYWSLGWGALALAVGLATMGIAIRQLRGRKTD